MDSPIKPPPARVPCPRCGESLRPGSINNRHLETLKCQTFTLVRQLRKDWLPVTWGLRQKMGEFGYRYIGREAVQIKSFQTYYHAPGWGRMAWVGSQDWITKELATIMLSGAISEDEKAQACKMQPDDPNFLNLLVLAELSNQGSLED